MISETRIYQQVNLNPDDVCGPVRPVRTKLDFYRRFYAGEFGNHGPMWSSLGEWRRSCYPGRIAIRTLVQGGRCDYDIPPGEVTSRTDEFRRDGWTSLNWSAMAPTEKTLIQGEVCRTSRGIEGFVSRDRLPMRPALARGGRPVRGPVLIETLRHFCCGQSIDWIMELLDRFDGHTIEFSTFSVPWGVVRGMNTVIWEVRRY